jgi:hypothetical protein
VITELRAAYKAIKAAQANEKAYKRFIGKDPDYSIIQSLINTARVDVVAIITFPNGTKLELKKADAFDRTLKAVLDPDRAAAF